MRRGVIKVVGRGGWSMILILLITKIFDKIHAGNLVCGLKLAFTYFAENFVKIACFYNI